LPVTAARITPDRHNSRPAQALTTHAWQRRLGRMRAAAQLRAQPGGTLALRAGAVDDAGFGSRVSTLDPALSPSGLKAARAPQGWARDRSLEHWQARRVPPGAWRGHRPRDAAQRPGR